MTASLPTGPPMRLVRLGALVVGGAYLAWRLLFTWQGADPLLFAILLAAEAFGIVRFAGETSLYGPTRPATRTPVLGIAPDADVVVMVTDEPASEVRAAVLSARLVHGYRSVLVVDRDDRLDVRELAERLGIERVVGGPGADLGDLVDEAITRGGSLFALLVPADVVVMPDVLEVVAPVFDEPNVGVVVCRVENTNAAHDTDFGGYGEDLVRDTLLLDRLDTAGELPWWAPMAVVRRSALAEAGGMGTGRRGVTLETGVRLQAAGWRITDVPVVAARRLAPWTDDRHLHRWARSLHERLALLVDRDAPLWGPHSSRLGRRVHLMAAVTAGRAVQRIALLGVLLATLFGGGLPVAAPASVFALAWGASTVASVAVRWALLRPIGFTPWIVGDLRLLTTDLVVAARALRGRELGDLTDPAPGRKARSVVLAGLQFGLIAVIGLFGTGIVRPAHGDVVTLACLGAAAWLWVMALLARSGLRVGQQRQGFRTREELDVVLADAVIRVVGLSPFGIDVRTARPLHEGERVRVRLALPQVDGSTYQFDTSTTVRRCRAAGEGYESYLRFEVLADEVADRVTEYGAVVAGHAALRDGSAADVAGRTDVGVELHAELAGGR